MTVSCPKSAIDIIGGQRSMSPGAGQWHCWQAYGFCTKVGHEPALSECLYNQFTVEKSCKCNCIILHCYYIGWRPSLVRYIASQSFKQTLFQPQQTPCKEDCLFCEQKRGFQASPPRPPGGGNKLTLERKLR